MNSIIERATCERASDIHLEPREIDLHVRMRIDGVLRTILTMKGPPGFGHLAFEDHGRHEHLERRAWDDRASIA
ncbi:MAG: hypothetical protein ACLU7P_06685 [Eggerthella lenta]